MSLNTNDRYNKFEFKMFGVDSPGKDFIPSDVSGRSLSARKHKLYHDVNNSFCTKSVKKHKTSDFNYRVSNENIQSNNTIKEQCFTVKNEDCSAELRINNDNSTCSEHDYSKDCDWAIDDVSSGCEDIPQENNSSKFEPLKIMKFTSPKSVSTFNTVSPAPVVNPKSPTVSTKSISCKDSLPKFKTSSKIDPIKLEKFASPISVPSAFKTLAPIKVVPLVNCSKSPGLQKAFSKQSVGATTPNVNLHIHNEVTKDHLIVKRTQDCPKKQDNTPKKNSEFFNSNSFEQEFCNDNSSAISKDSIQYQILDDSPVKTFNYTSEFGLCSSQNNSGKMFGDSSSIGSQVEYGDKLSDMSHLIQDDLTPVKSLDTSPHKFIQDDTPEKSCDTKRPCATKIISKKHLSVVRNIDDEEAITTLTPVKKSHFYINDETPEKISDDSSIDVKLIDSVKERTPLPYAFIEDNQINCDDNYATPIKNHIININDDTPEKITDETCIPSKTITIGKDKTPIPYAFIVNNQINCDDYYETPIKKHIININDETPEKIDSESRSLINPNIVAKSKLFNSRLSVNKVKTPTYKHALSILDDTPEKPTNHTPPDVKKCKLYNLSSIVDNEFDETNYSTPVKYKRFNIHDGTPDKELINTSVESVAIMRKKTPVVRCFDKQFNDESDDISSNQTESVLIKDDSPEKQSDEGTFSFKTIDILRKNSSVLKFLASDKTGEDTNLNNASPFSKTKISDWKPTIDSYKSSAEDNQPLANEKYNKENRIHLMSSSKCDVENALHHKLTKRKTPDKKLSVNSVDEDLSSHFIKEVERRCSNLNQPLVFSPNNFLSDKMNKTTEETPGKQKKGKLSFSVLKSSVKLSPIPRGWLSCDNVTPVKDMNVSIQDETPEKKKHVVLENSLICDSLINDELNNDTTPVKVLKINIQDDTPVKKRLNGLGSSVTNSPILNSCINDELTNDKTPIKSSQISIQDDTPEKKRTNGLWSSAINSPIVNSCINDELSNDKTPIRASQISIQDDTPEKKKIISFGSNKKNSPIVNSYINNELSNDETPIKASQISIQDDTPEKKKTISFGSDKKNSPIVNSYINDALSNDETPIKDSNVNIQDDSPHKKQNINLMPKAVPSEWSNGEFSYDLSPARLSNIKVRNETSEILVRDNPLRFSRTKLKKRNSLGKRNITSCLKDVYNPSSVLNNLNFRNPGPDNSLFNDNLNCDRNVQGFLGNDNSPLDNCDEEIEESISVQSSPLDIKSTLINMNKTSDSDDNKTILNDDLNISDHSEDSNREEIETLIKDDETPSNSQVMFINDNTPSKINEFNITEESTPTKKEVDNQLSNFINDKLLLNSRVKKRKQQILIAINHDSTDVENCLEEEKMFDDNFIEQQAYDIDAFPSPSKDASVMPCERESAVIAEIPGLTPRKTEYQEDGVMLFSKKKKRLLQSNTLLSKAVSAVNNLKSTRKLFSYELQVGLRSIDNQLISDQLKILKMWKDHSSYYIQCQLLSDLKNLDDTNNINPQTIIFIINYRPKDVCINDSLKVYYPVQIFNCKNQENVLIGFAYYLEFSKSECTKNQSNNEIKYESNRLILDNSNLSGIFQNKIPEVSYIYLNSTKSENISKAIFNCSLTNSVSVKLIILHSIKSKSKAIFIALDDEKSLCVIEFNKNYNIEKIRDNTICYFNNMRFQKRINILESEQIRTIFEFTCCEMFNKNTVVNILTPRHNWCSNQDFIEVENSKINTKLSNFSKIEDIDLKVTKRYKVKVIIKKLTSNKLLAQSPKSNYEFSLILNDPSLLHIAEQNQSLVIDGLLCYNKQLVIDKFSSIYVL